MSRYDNCSREELLRRIEELEAQLDTPKGSGSRFRERYACKILDSIPDMLTVLDRDGTLVELVSADETNHVGVPGGELAGQNIRTMLSPAACRNVKNNLDNVFATGCGSTFHHDITKGRSRIRPPTTLRSTAEPATTKTVFSRSTGSMPSASAVTSPRPKLPSMNWRWSNMH